MSRKVPPAISRLVFALVMVSCAYFVQGAGANQNSRYGLVRAAVTDRTFRIDPYRTSTWDISSYAGHWYSDKAPGLALAAVVPYALGGRFVQDPRMLEPNPAALHLLTLATCSLATAFAAVAMLEMLVAWGLGLTVSLLAVLGWVLGTNAFGYAGLFLAHQFAASLIVLALAGIAAAARAESERRRFWLVFAAGFAASYAVVSEFPVAILALALAGYALATLGLRRALPLALGAIPPALVLAGYNLACFGSPLHLGYQSLAMSSFAGGLHTGLFGFGPPSLHVMAELTVHEYRGLLPLSPFLVFALPGLWWLLRDPSRRALGILCAGAFGTMLVVLSGFEFWDGGAAMGPRHLVPAVPFLIIAAAVAFDRIYRRWPRLGLANAMAWIGVSIVICTLAVAVQPEFFDTDPPAAPAPEIPPADREHPIRQIILPLFETGYVSNKATKHGLLGYASFFPAHDDDAYNLGEKLGLDGTWSLVPLLLAWAGIGAAIGWRLRVARRDATASG